MEKIQLALEKARQDRTVTLDREARERLPRTSGPGAGRQADGEAIPIQEVSRGQLRRSRIVVPLQGSRASEAYRVLRTHVQTRLDVIGGRTFAVSSPRPGDGKTVAAINLAVAFAQQVDRSAVLVDLDLRQPAVARYLGLTVENETADYLQGRKSLAECLIRPGLDDLVVLPQRRPAARPSELLSSQQMVKLTQELKAMFPERVILYDCPPLLIADDALVVKGLVDGMLLVVREGRTTRGDLQRAGQLVGEDAFLGSVVNRATWSLDDNYHY